MSNVFNLPEDTRVKDFQEVIEAHMSIHKAGRLSQVSVDMIKNVYRHLEEDDRQKVITFIHERAYELIESRETKKAKAFFSLEERITSTVGRPRYKKGNYVRTG